MSEWLTSLTELPNLHPAVVHLPLGLLPVAVLLDGASMLLRRQRWVGYSAVLLYSLGSLGAWLAVLAGEQAADSLIGVPPRLQPAIATHSDWGHYAAYVFTAVSAARLADIAWTMRSRSPSRPGYLLARGAVLLAGFAGLGVLVRAADLGGGLVYREGLAVAVVSESNLHDQVDLIANQRVEPAASAGSSLIRSDDGTLVWHPQAGDREALGTTLSAASGSSLEAVSTDILLGDGEQQGLALRVDGRVLLVLQPTFGDVQLDLQVDRSKFRGVVALAHHVSDVANFESFVVDDGGTVSLVQTVSGKENVLDQEDLAPTDFGDVYSVSVTGGHLKGMIDGATLVHGHAPSLAVGQVGILIDGRGVLRMRSLTVTPLAKGDVR